MQEYEIEFYDKADGSEPAKEFILSLDKKMQAKVLRTVALLREEGPFLREPYSKALDDGIFEIRTKFGSDITRVLYFFVVGKKVILTNGFIKKTQKTPASGRGSPDCAGARRQAAEAFEISVFVTHAVTHFLRYTSADMVSSVLLCVRKWLEYCIL